MKIATWNVNSIKARIGHVLDWLDAAQPDVLLLQELKMADESFPRLEIEGKGYAVETVGQKTYNGVALISREPATITARALPGDGKDAQARYIEGTIGKVRVASIYLPNGNPVDSDKFPYKLKWMERLTRHAAKLLAAEEPVVLGGDFNICPTDADVYDPKLFANDALCHGESRRRFRTLVNLGFTDAYRALHPSPGAYTFWDYQGGRWNKDEGLRIDHLLLSPEAADRLSACEIDRKPRGLDRPSDHTPVWAEFDFS